jgi:hypothetical protein
MSGLESVSAPFSQEFDPCAFGAATDGRKLSTRAIQQALDAASAAGGGTVRLKAGIYLSGTLELPSHVTLHLDAGAILRGSKRIADYRRGNWPALIKARGQTGVSITGQGTIHGQGRLVAADVERIKNMGTPLELFPGLKPGTKILTTSGTGPAVQLDPHALAAEGRLMEAIFPGGARANEFVRPQLLEFWQCKDVRVEGVTLRDATCWVQTYRECEGVRLAHLKVRSTAFWNNDGIDIVDCKRVRIEHCDIDAADDGICLKSDFGGAGCEDVEIAHCRLRTSASAFKLGTASHGGFRRIRAHDLEVYNTYRSAVAIECVDGGLVEDIVVERVRAMHTGNAFFIYLGHRTKSRPPGILRHITLRDFDVSIPAERPDAGYEHEGPPVEEPHNLIPASIVGLPAHPVENITLENITLIYGGGASRERAEIPLDKLDRVPERPGDYPEFSMWGELPAWALYVRHAQDLRLENLKLSLRADDFRPALVADDVQRISLRTISAHATESPSPLVFHSVKEFTIHDAPPVTEFRSQR